MQKEQYNPVQSRVVENRGVEAIDATPLSYYLIDMTGKLEIGQNCTVYVPYCMDTVLFIVQSEKC